MVGKVPACQSGGPGSIPGDPGIGYVSFDCVVSDSGPENVVNTHSGRPALVYVLCSGPQSVAPLQASDPRALVL